MRRSKSTSSGRPFNASVRTWLALVEWAVSRDHLPTANRALFSIASRYMKLTLGYATIMEGMFIGPPIIVLATVTTRPKFLPWRAEEGLCWAAAISFLPSLDHRNTTIQGAFRLGDFRNTSMQVGREICDLKLDCWGHDGTSRVRQLVRDVLFALRSRGERMT
jgi:hypothetical protein